MIRVPDCNAAIKVQELAIERMSRGVSAMHPDVEAGSESGNYLRHRSLCDRHPRRVTCLNSEQIDHAHHA